MKLMDLYNQIKNPIYDEETIEKLLIAYINAQTEPGGFYYQLVKSKEKKDVHFNTSDRDHFYSMLFNKWKNSIVNLSKEDYERLQRNGIYGHDFAKMRNFLRYIPDVKTEREANSIIFGKYSDKELEDALNKYRWTAFGEGNFWVHVCSNTLTAGRDKYPNIEHRLYLGTDTLDTYKMVSYLVEEFDKYHLPYYFKFNKCGNRDDSIVIYSSTETLTAYVEILQEIKREHPDLITRMKKPPMLTGKLDGWIGYGSERVVAPGEKTPSYNSIRANIIETSIDKVVKKWMLDHQNMPVIYQGKRISFQDYISLLATNKFLKKLEEQYNLYEQVDKDTAKKNRLLYSPNTTINTLGFTKEDITSPIFKESIYNIIKSSMSNCLTNICNGKTLNTANIRIDVSNGKQICFYGHYLEEIIRKLSISIFKNDVNFINSLLQEISKNSKDYNIDTDKFCFDLIVKERMKKSDAEASRKEQYLPKEGIPSQSEADINYSSLNAHSLLKTISKGIIEKQTKLPNGSRISASQYIQEVVFPHLPKNGVVMLDNGAILSTKQFIEECIIGECQEKYNGNFPKYLAERTRANMGVINIEQNGKLYQINPKEITSFIKPELLEEQVKLPNGNRISAKQYIEEIYAPHIPTNGYVTLNNNKRVSAKEYIEEVLLLEGQILYNGDIGQILYNTTKQNNGTINCTPKTLQENLSRLANQITTYRNKATYLKPNNLSKKTV